MQALNGVNLLYISAVITLAAYNCVKFVWKKSVRSLHILAFYFCCFFCLVSWLITSTAQIFNVGERYLAFQLIDDPEFHQDMGDISQISFLCMFALISSTMYHMDQSLTFLLPERHKQSSSRAKRNVKVYNWLHLVLVLLYLAAFLGIYFTKYDVKVTVALAVDMSFRCLLLTIYTFTVCSLHKKFGMIGNVKQKRQISSIEVQFMSFLICIVL